MLLRIWETVNEFPICRVGWRVINGNIEGTIGFTDGFGIGFDEGLAVSLYVGFIVGLRVGLWIGFKEGLADTTIGLKLGVPNDDWIFGVFTYFGTDGMLVSVGTNLLGERVGFLVGLSEGT